MKDGQVSDQVLYEKKLPQGKFSTFATQSTQSSPSFPYFHVKQVHGSEIIALTSLLQKPEFLVGEADGLVVFSDYLKAFSPPPPLMISTADCLPILLLGEFGYAHLHAGWRGLHNPLLDHPHLKAINPSYAFIGPSIHACCFKVTEEFKNYFPQSAAFSEREGQLFFDLQTEAQSKLRRINQKIQIEDSGICTCCNQNFFSYRREKSVGRNRNLFEW